MRKTAGQSRASILTVVILCGLSSHRSHAQQLTANAELGQPNFTSSNCDNPALGPAQMLCHPVGVAVSANGLLAVADSDDNRFLIWPSASKFTNGQAASVVLGQTSFALGGKCTGGTTKFTICDPNAARFDSGGNLWVADTDGDRILAFSPPFTKGQAAFMVIGQRSFTTSICGVDATTLCSPRDLGFDTSGNLWVVDSGNNRVLVFLAPLSNSEAAKYVIGQADLTSKHCNRNQPTPGADTLCGPKGLALDSSGNLWVSEDDNSRVLEYDQPLLQFQSGTTDVSANLIYGEPTFSSAPQCNVTQNGVCHPDRVALGTKGQLLISDGDNNRILIFDSPLSNTIPNSVIGQPNLTSNTAATTANGLAGPKGLTVDGSGNLYVTDEDNNRLLRVQQSGIIRTFHKRDSAVLPAPVR